MKPEIKYIPFETFQDIIVKSGLPFEELAGFVKVTGAKGRKVYIPRTQRVGRVDISGFEYPGEGVLDLGDDAFGGVKQQLDFTGDPEQTLENFVNVLQHMVTLPPVEPRTRSARGSEPGQEASGQGGTRRRLGRPSMTVPPPEGPSVQEQRLQQGAQQAANQNKDKGGKKQPSHQPRRR